MRASLDQVEGGPDDVVGVDAVVAVTSSRAPDWPKRLTPSMETGALLTVARKARVCGCPSRTVTSAVARSAGKTWS
ncbi:hypothetical protein [Wenjunlia tyrosinilytica]|uniref:Uncharacterized protein n=1 Tax=Wenjunlia tyrosinilytica TaxID=1544741 RepID=A0A917ZSD2_9ACTN|nr:hypothetical protein [Wenjunlia tyrosinilytica]GGO91118.1 hypothetical protein GCM10012280_38210 [Wenjunlia tyrosinilytica]